MTEYLWQEASQCYAEDNRAAFNCTQSYIWSRNKNNKILRSRYYTVANYWQTWSITWPLCHSRATCDFYCACIFWPSDLDFDPKFKMILSHLPENMYNGANFAQLRFTNAVFRFDLVSEIKIFLEIRLWFMGIAIVQWQHLLGKIVPYLVTSHMTIVLTTNITDHMWRHRRWRDIMPLGCSSVVRVVTDFNFVCFSVI